MSNKIHTDKAPAAIGPYSQAVVVDRLIFTSGQIPLDPVSGAMVGENITEQTHRVCQNLEAIESWQRSTTSAEARSARRQLTISGAISGKNIVRKLCQRL